MIKQSTNTANLLGPYLLELYRRETFCREHPAACVLCKKAIITADCNHCLNTRREPIPMCEFDQ